MQIIYFCKVMRYLLLLICAAQFSTHAQKNMVNQFNGWALYNGFYKVSGKTFLMSEYQWRRAEGFRHWQQSLLRFGVGYQITPEVSLMGGYAWIKTFPYGVQPILHEFDENRIFEQVNVKHKMGRFELQHRYRIEQRFLEQYAKNSGAEIAEVSPIYLNRIRYRAMVTFPITRKELAKNTLFLNLNNELFVGFGKGIAKNPLDQNRFIAAMGWQFTSNSNVQLGYLNQFIIKPNATDMERNHILWISWIHRVDLTKVFEKAAGN